MSGCASIDADDLSEARELKPLPNVHMTLEEAH